jgi:hypothetical protein
MFRIQPSPEITERGEFAALCNQYELREAAEIGVDRGGFAAEFMSKWNGFTLLLVDPYEPYEGMTWPREMDRATAIQRMVPFADRVRFIPWASPAAAGQIPADWVLNFIYIDGSHTEPAVAADLEAWWGRLAKHGILAGHDWVTDPENGVVRAVTAFADRHHLTVYTTVDIPASWYIKKWDHLR